MTKTELRKLYLEKRRQTGPDDAAEYRLKIAALFLDLLDTGNFKAVHCFLSVAKSNEVDTLPIFEGIWTKYPAVETYAPRLAEQPGDIESVRISRETPLIENSWGIREPVGLPVAASVMDVVIVPLLCFDRGGHRVGYGKGYYDRLLAECRPDCVKIGLSFFPPVEEIGDLHGADVPLDLVITPNETFRFS
ncbi:MAG: 5-formyltetrahydrofolate cyclo-ligase [Blastocatellia bacterium]|nr:5-formyltetrahydrofolate cyclo-ligase [Blastocatellia bacterium]